MGSTPTPAQALSLAVHTGLDALVDLRGPHPRIADGQVELRLREAVALVERATRHPGRGPNALALAAAAARTACSHLSARQLEDCYLALRTALDHLGGHDG